MKCTRNLKLWHTTIINFDEVAAKRTFKIKSQISKFQFQNQQPNSKTRTKTQHTLRNPKQKNDKTKYIKTNVQVSAKKKKKQDIKSLVRFSAASNNKNNILYIYK